MALRQTAIKKGIEHVICLWKAYVLGNWKNHVAKAENVGFNSYSSPLQRHSLSSIEFLENFHCILLENICLYTSIISTIFA